MEPRPDPRQPIERRDETLFDGPYAILPLSITLKQYPCPTCGSMHRWDKAVVRHGDTNNPELIVLCDCGRGELRVILV